MFVTCFQMYLQTGVKEVLCLPSLFRKEETSIKSIAVYSFPVHNRSNLPSRSTRI